MQINEMIVAGFSQKAFDDFLQSLKNEEKVEWTKNSINTNMPVLAINAKQINDVVKTIKKQEDYFLAFLENAKFNYYESTIIYAKLLNQIKDFDTLKNYLDKYVPQIDNWASCDSLSLELKGKDRAKLFDLAVEYTQSPLSFVRRVGFRIMFRFVDGEYINKVFDVIEHFGSEQEYYVNMIISWLLCDCFIKCREQTLAFLQKAKLNAFVSNKFVSKCRDSFRVSSQDKDMLVSFRKK